MLEIALVALDLDGTLLTSEKTLAPESARLLTQASRRGLSIILASTRNPHSVQPFCQQLEINDPLICANGAWILGTPSGPLWDYQTIPLQAARRIAQFADEHHWELSTSIKGMTYLRQRPGQALGPQTATRTIMPTNESAILDDPTMMLAFEPEASEKIRCLCQSELNDQVRTEAFINPDGTFQSLVICPVNSDKGKALEFVLNRMAIPIERVMAIGDNFVDIPMFRSAGISVAMGNAPEKVKQAATVIAPSNDDEGVAWALGAFKIGVP